MDLINWSLSAIDTIFSTRSLGSGEPVCPDGTFAAGYTRDTWESWQIVCLAALSVEDIEDIYLFGTMITGILLIGLGFALGYRKIQKTGTAVQSLKRLPVLIEAVGRAVSIETETINWNMDSITMKLTALQVKIDSFGDQNGQREQLWRYAAVRPKDKTNQSYLFWLPRTSRPRPRPCWITTLGRALQWDSLALSPITDITPLPRSTAPTALLRLVKRVCDQRCNKWRRTGLLARFGYVSPCCKVMCLWYTCFCAEVFFSVLTLYSSMEHSLGVKTFFLLSSCNAVIFFNSLSSCPVYPLVCMLCMGRLMAYFTGTCD